MLQFKESDIRFWSDKYDALQNQKGREKEKSLHNFRTDIRQSGFMTKEQLKVIADWKAPRSASHVEKNSADFVKEITAWSLSAKEERSKIEVLTLLNGILWPSASVILHFFHQDPYPILDWRALNSLGIKNQKQTNQYSFSFWVMYVEFCREVAQHNSVDMRTLDKALWQFSKSKGVQ